MAAKCSKDAQAGRDTSALTLLTLLSKSFHKNCCGKRAPWSKEACALTLFCVLWRCPWEAVKGPPLERWNSPLVQSCWMYLRGWHTVGERRVLRQKGERNIQLPTLQGLTASGRAMEQFSDTVFYPAQWYAESRPQAFLPS